MWNPDDFKLFKREAKIKALENRNLIGPSSIDIKNNKTDD
jgi:hypothetical protein